MALKEKNSFQHEEIKENIQLTPLKEVLLKQEKAYKYSKKLKQYVDANIYLHRDILEIEKIRSKKDSIIIPLSSISEIREIYDKSFKHGYNTMMISTGDASQIKQYYLSFRKDSFESWFIELNNHLHQFLDTFSFLKINKDLNELNRKKTSLLIQLVNKFTNIKGVLSIKFSKKLFYDFYDNKKIKEIYDSIKIYQENINNNNYEAALENLNKVIDIFEQNKDIKNDFDENKNIFEILMQYSEKIKEIIENNKDNNNDNKIKNEIKNNDMEIKKNDGFFYNLIDSLTKKYFEPQFNKIMESKERKMDFLNKIMDYILKGQNKEDNEFYDINSNVNELIIIEQ